MRNMRQWLDDMRFEASAYFFRRLAKDYDEAGQHPVWAKLTEVAADLEAPAIALERSKRR